MPASLLEQNQLTDLADSTHADRQPKPNPYLTGGYQSPDILIFDSMNNPIPLAGSAIGSTQLLPNTNYWLSAIIHNDSSVDAVNTIVRFWEIPLGAAVDGNLLDVRTVTVPANGCVQVECSFPFRSAPPGVHSCAAVSIYNAESAKATVDPTTASQIPWTYPRALGPTAWRNTDSLADTLG